ncbi:MAG TPA: O-antigen ligase family protein [Thermomicrobiales bacterium]|nr:O-antigen ligase family protein [Thermomicrobiales bacterium]
MAAQQQALRFRLIGPLGFGDAEVVPWSLVVGFAALIAALLAARMGQIVELAFPALALLVGATLYFRHPTLYLGFTWWLWFLAPEVRRLVDYQIGWNEISPVMIAPYLVSGVAALTLVRRLPQLLQPRLFPFALILMALNYAYVVGLVRAGPLAATYGLLTWLVPALLGFHVAAHWQRYPSYRDALQRVFLWGVLAMGIYGIVQFLALPAWDAYWMRVSDMSSIGGPQPFRVRIWSTMNSPQPFALAMMAGLLFAFAAKGWFRFVAAGPGYVSLLLSLVRTAWLGWAIGLVVLFARARGVHKARLLAVGLGVGLLSLPLLLLDPVADRVTARFETMQDLGEDESLRARLALYREFFLASAGNVVGQGIGSANLATKLAEDGDLAEYRTIDSGVLEAMFVLGWPGTLLYLGGLGGLLGGAFGGRAERDDVTVAAAGAVVVAILAMAVSHNTLIGVGGSVLWTFLGLMLAAQRCERQSRAAPVPAPDERRPPDDPPRYQEGTPTHAPA